MDDWLKHLTREGDYGGEPRLAAGEWGRPLLTWAGTHYEDEEGGMARKKGNAADTADKASQAEDTATDQAEDAANGSAGGSEESSPS